MTQPTNEASKLIEQIESIVSPEVLEAIRFVEALPSWHQPTLTPAITVSAKGTGNANS